MKRAVELISYVASASRRNLAAQRGEKAVSALAVQNRTEKMGLADFLYQRRVPGVEAGAYAYADFLDRQLNTS